MTAVAVPSEKGLVLLVDLSAIFRACWHANENGDVSVAFQATLDGVRRCEGLYRGARVAICCDGKNNWRKKVAPSYKANRDKQPESLYGELDRVKARLRDDGHLLWEFDGYEADDVIASATDAALVSGCDVVIATHDKDALQLVRHGVRVLRTHTWVEVDAAKVTEKFGVEPYKLAGWQALVGDKSDNVAGAPGIGEVKATALIRRYGGISQLLAAVEKEPDEVAKTPCGKGALGFAAVKAIAENKAQIELALTLVTPKYDVPLKFEDVFSDRQVKPLTGDSPMDSEPITDTIIEGVPIDAKVESVGQYKPQPSQALAVVSNDVVPYERGLEPRDMGMAWKLAQTLFNSRLYTKFTNAEAIMAVIIRGRELGVGATTALECFFVVEGRPYASASFIIAKAKADPDCEYFQMVESTATTATWETKSRRNPKPTRFTYTIEQARLAGLSKGNWTTRPDDMLVKTAGSKLARLEYPGAILGVYSMEEIGA